VKFSAFSPIIKIAKISLIFTQYGGHLLWCGLSKGCLILNCVVQVRMAFFLPIGRLAKFVAILMMETSFPTGISVCYI
jgi:hypothetical protein